MGQRNASVKILFLVATIELESIGSIGNKGVLFLPKVDTIRGDTMTRKRFDKASEFWAFLKSYDEQGVDISISEHYAFGQHDKSIQAFVLIPCNVINVELTPA